jgi:glycosyltransferase involved in cell wall biosynthesis
MKRMKLKVLICSNAYPPHFIGGAELVAHAQAKQLQMSGHEVIVFTGDPSEHGKRHSYRREDYEGIPVYRIHLTHEDYDYRFLNFIHKDIEDHFKKLLLKVSPDIVHFHNIIGLSAGLIHCAKSQGKKTVVTLHDHWGFCFKNTLIKNDNTICQEFSHCSDCMPVIPGENICNIPIRMRQDFLAMQLEEVDAFISPSRYLADAYIRAGIPQEKIHIIWNGLNVTKFSNIKKIPDPSGCCRFTFIGYFGKHKGIHVLLEALQYLDKQQNFRLNLVGSGELVEEFKKEIREKGLNNKVKFWGRIEYIETAYAETDVFILPSVWPENQPVSITEAMSAGIPVIASDIGGIPELVEDGKTGYLFRPGDARDLAKKMSEFIPISGFARIFGKVAFEKIKKYTIELQTRKIIDVYSQILGKNPDISADRVVIICKGDHLDPVCAKALRMMSSPDFQKIRFVLSEWLQDDQKENGTLLWIINEWEKFSQKDPDYQYLLPLLVPENNVDFKKICMKYNCGLFYNGSLEAFCTLEYLLNNRDLLKIMIENRKKAQ